MAFNITQQPNPEQQKPTGFVEAIVRRPISVTAYNINQSYVIAFNPELLNRMLDAISKAHGSRDSLFTTLNKVLVDFVGGH